MPRNKTNPHRKYFVFNIETAINTCQVKEDGEVCGKNIKGDHASNLTQHIMHKHPKIWEQEASTASCSSISKRKGETQPMEIPCKKIPHMFHSTISLCLTKEGVKEACVEMCSVNGRPFSMMEDSGFRKILDPILKAFGNQIAVNPHNVRDGVIKKAKDIVSAVTLEVKGKMLSLKLDGLTHLGRSFLGINIQFIEKGKVVLRSLATQELFEKHTSEHLKKITLDVLQKFAISPEQIYTCTTDNGKNMVKCVSLLTDDPEEHDSPDNEYSEERHDALQEQLSDLEIGRKCIGVRCAAHTMQLAVHAVLEHADIKPIISRARDVVKKLRTPNMNILITNQQITKPSIDCLTRWSSTFDMLKSLVNPKMQQFCKNLEDANKSFYINGTQWKALENLVAVLEPAEVATTKFQSEQLTYGDFFGIWLSCKIEIQNQKASIAASLYAELCRREQILFENDAFNAAIFMDPRWNIMLSEERRKKAIDTLKVLYTQIMVNQEKMSSNDTDSNDESDANTSSPPCDELEMMLRPLEGEKRKNEKQINHAEIIHPLLVSFLKEKRVEKNTNVLIWWTQQVESNPKLYELSKVALGVPATQVSVERLFSGVKYIKNPLRNKMDSSALNAVMIIRTNHLFRLPKN